MIKFGSPTLQTHSRALSSYHKSIGLLMFGAIGVRVLVRLASVMPPAIVQHPVGSVPRLSSQSSWTLP